MIQAQVVVDRFLRNSLSAQYCLNIYEKMILIMLASYIGKNKDCFPGHPELACACSMSIPKLKRSIVSLEQKRLINVRRSLGENNNYSLTIPLLLEAIPSSIGTQVCENPVPAELSTQLHESLLPSSDRATNNISNNINNNISISSPKKTSKNKYKNKTHFPNYMKIDDAHRSKAHSLGLDVDSEFEHFKEHHIAKGNQFSDWGMAFHKWLRYAVKFRQSEISPLQKSLSTNPMLGAGHE